MRTHWLGLALVVVACSDGASTVSPASGSSGVPNTTSSSSSSSSGHVSSSSSSTSSSSSGDSGTTPPVGGNTVRLMAANLSSGNNQSYDEGEGARIFQGLHPDIVMIQEFNYGDKSDTAMRTFVDATFGTDFSVYRESGAGLNIPNGVISRYPILQSGRFVSAAPDRGYVYAQIQVPGAHPLWAVSVHLLTKDAATREAQAEALVPQLQALVPAGDYLAIGGDFNTTTRDEQCLTTFNAIVDAANSHAADQAGIETTNAPRNKPYDWVLASPGLTSLQVPTVIGANSFPNGLVFDSRVYTPLTDVAPVQLNDSGSLNMQHMGIVKDFSL